MKPRLDQAVQLVRAGRPAATRFRAGRPTAARATSFFCSAVSVGSDGLRVLTAKPLPTLAVLVAVLLLVSTLAQQALVAARPHPTPPAWAVVTGYLLLVVTLVVAQAATVQAVKGLDETREVSVRSAYRRGFGRLGPLLGTLTLVALVLALLGASVVLGVVALVLIWACACSSPWWSWSSDGASQRYAGAGGRWLAGLGRP